jgi:hypothetical protein
MRRHASLEAARTLLSVRDRFSTLWPSSCLHQS